MTRSGNGRARRKYVLDTNCYVDASRREADAAALEDFAAAAAPMLYLSSVVAAELRAGAGSGRLADSVEQRLVEPFSRRGRIMTPGAASWSALGRTLALLREKDGLNLKQVPRNFILDILIAHSCRETGATLVTRNEADMRRISKAFRFEYVAPFPQV